MATIRQSRTSKVTRLSGYARSGQIARQDLEQVFVNGTEQVVVIRENIGYCTSCNRALNEKNPVAGICSSCQQYICTACSDKNSLCALCGRVVCSRRECSSLFHEKPVCNSHGFLEKLRFELVAKR